MLSQNVGNDGHASQYEEQLQKGFGAAKKMISSVGGESSSSGRGLADYISMFLFVISCVVLFIIAKTHVFPMVILMGLMLLKNYREILQTLKTPGMGKGFLAHYAWGYVCFVCFLHMVQECFNTLRYARMSMFALEVTAWVFMIGIILVTCLIHFVGFKLLNKFKPEWKSQGRLVFGLVSFGIMLALFLIKNNTINSIFDGNSIDAVDSNNVLDSDAVSMNYSDTSTDVTGSSVNVTGMDSVSGDSMAQTQGVSGDFSNMGNGMNSTNDSYTIMDANGVPQQTVQATPDGFVAKDPLTGNTTVMGVNNGDGTMLHGFDGANGMIYNDGSLLNDLMLPDGRVEVTSPGNGLIFDANQQVAYFIRDNKIYDNLSNFIGSIQTN